MRMHPLLPGPRPAGVFELCGCSLEEMRVSCLELAGKTDRRGSLEPKGVCVRARGKRVGPASNVLAGAGHA